MIWLLISAALLVAILLICAYTYKICFYSPKDRLEDPYSEMEIDQYEDALDDIHRCTSLMERTPFKWVNIRSWDGTPLRGRYYHTADGAPVMLMFHGYRSMALRDCAGGFLLGKKLGFNILAVDQRAHGGSGGRTITFGVKERRDCQSWAEFVTNWHGMDTPVILAGLSMGAATVLMASDLPLPSNVVCITADCPYSSVGGILRKVSKDEGYPAKLIYPFLWLGARIFGNFNPSASSAVASVANTKVPILLIHGEQDDFVPCDMSREIFRANPDAVTLQTFPNAGHGLSYMSDPVRYEQITVDFFRNIPKLKEYMERDKNDH